MYSFIVPVYNTSKYLDKCMQSLLCQRGAVFEILLIDDGSTDNSGELCDQYAEQNPNVVRVIHKENEGLLLTRRRGFKEAKGDWFICIDSDDYADEHLLENVVSAIEKYHPDMVMYNFQYVDDNGKKSQSRLRIENESVYVGDEKQSIYAQRLLSDDINNMWSKALKREIVDIDADYINCGIRNMCEDAIQVLPLFTNANTIVYLSTPLYNYRKGQSSITSTGSYENWISIKTSFLITENYLDVWTVSDEIRHKFYTRNVEVLSNFLRWVVTQHEDNLPYSLSEIIHTIRNHSAFERCMTMYNKAYSKTAYLKYSVPIIMKYVKKEDVKGMKKYLAFEKKVLSMIK